MLFIGPWMLLCWLCIHPANIYSIQYMSNF